MSDLVSIVMPAYNNGKYVAGAIQSVLAQTHREWELLFVDDGSTDRTLEIARSFRDPRIRILRNGKNAGAALSRNRGLREAKGKWIAFLDAEDWWHPEKLVRQLAFMDRGGYSFSCTDYRMRLNGVWQDVVWTGPRVVNKWRMYNYAFFSTITVMYDREKVGLVQIADLKKNNDYAMWLKVIEKARCYRLSECLSFYIKHDGSLTSGSKLKLIRWHYALFRQGQGFGPVVSSLLTLNNLFFGVVKKLAFKRALTEEDRRLKEETEAAVCRQIVEEAP